MSTTILTGKHAAAFKLADGTAIYALFERIHDSNCDPHVPTWHCQAIGNYKEALVAITKAMVSCESQGLQARNGVIAPESLLKHWYRLLAKPTRLPNHVIEVGVGRNGEMSDNQRRDAVKALSDIGRLDLADQLAAGAVTLSLHDDIDVVLRLFGIAGPLRPWQGLDYSEVHTLPQNGFALLPASSKAAATVNPDYEVKIVGQHHVLVRERDQLWGLWGYRYSAVQRFIQRHCVEMEMENRLSSVRAIADFRGMVNDGVAIPGDTLIDVYKPPLVVVADYVVSWYHDLANRFGVPSATKLSVTVDEVAAAGMLEKLCAMPQPYLRWHIAEPEMLHNGPLALHDASVPKQLNLFL